GITRARQRLYLAYAWSRTLFGQTQYNPPSRFLSELPEHLLDVREAVARSRHRGRGAGAAIRAEAQRGYSVIGLPGRGGTVEVAGGGTPRPTGVPRRAAPAIVAGDTVAHDRWGEGVVVTTSGSGDDAEATIRFEDVGEKRVLLAYAPLRKIG